MLMLNDFHNPSNDVDGGTDDTCIILILRLVFISLGLKMTYFACMDHILMVNVYVEHISYFHKPRADGWMMHVCIILSLRLMFSVYYLNFFCQPGSDVEP